ncbi:hypothetical protein HDU98_000890, partial [Podochytrium sp. JEL0797]
DSPAPLTGINGLDDTDQDFLSALLKINSPNSTAEVTASTSLMTPPASFVQSPPKSKQEAEEKACQDMPHLVAAYDSLKSIPSLAKDESLLDELCDAFVACSTKCERAVIENNGVCPGDNLQGPEKEAMKIVQSKMLAQCSGEDQVRFLEVMEEVREKNKEHIKKKVAVAVLLGGEGIRGVYISDLEQTAETLRRADYQTQQLQLRLEELQRENEMLQRVQFHLLGPQPPPVDNGALGIA